MQTKNILILVGTIWPIVGFFLAILIAFLFTGWKRWLVLFFGPVVMLFPCYIYAQEIAYNGNMLFVTLAGIVFVLGCIYYLLLIVTGIVLFIRNRSAQKIE